MQEERFTAKMYVEYIAKHKGISIQEIGVAPTVVISWGQKVIHSFIEKLNAYICPNWFYDEGHVIFNLYTTDYFGQKISFVLSPEGAPATVMMMEELIACGARTIIGLGWAGSLQSHVGIGTLLIPINCISQEGTSKHYISCSQITSPDQEIVNLLIETAQINNIKIVSGSLWTTDAPYRERIDTIEMFKSLGVIGVDMETSAMYAVANFYGIKVCNLLVISDELWQDWKPEFRSPELRKSTEVAEDLLIIFLKKYLCNKPINN
jgi:uridine phosphorylase